MINVDMPIVPISLSQVLYSLESAAALGDAVLDGIFNEAHVETPFGVDLTSFGRHLFPGELLINPDYSPILPTSKERLSNLAMGVMYLESGIVDTRSENNGHSPSISRPYILFVIP